MTAESQFLTVEQVAAKCGKRKKDPVYAWIASGELRATNLATSKTGRPLWMVRPADLSSQASASSSSR